MSGAASDPILDVSDLRVQFRSEGSIVTAVGGVSLRLRRGEVLGLVGESGCGKSVMNLAVMGLIPSPPGYVTAERIVFDGEDLRAASPEHLRSLRGRRIAMIFQDPMTSLNPYLTVERQLTEVLEVHRGMSRSAARDRAIEMLEQVGIPDAARRIDSHPHEFSGGMRQRVMIAMALLCEPELLIADEPTTALDVTIQAQILDLIRDLQRRTGTSVILITHDLGVVAGMADRVAVMYAGKIVESGTAEEVLTAGAHPYTQGLLASVPRLGTDKAHDLLPIAGLPPDLSSLPSGCAFHPRCGRVTDRCRSEVPTPTTLSMGHEVCCHHPGPAATPEAP